MSKKTILQSLLEVPFQELAKERRKNNELPEDLRQEIFETIDQIKQAEETEDGPIAAKETSTEFIEKIKKFGAPAPPEDRYYGLEEMPPSNAGS